eukprot:TRINITY_DN4302_c0_g1_i4.p2 TRINITY_DN4302_c0_g1~~TRINITY_DN4302_c0_g1_i4.p2  ORF type:complete len:101 (-),score=1.54 TRINITY_DN4302_c0_g1_i4:917-1219(-)
MAHVVVPKGSTGLGPERRGISPRWQTGHIWYPRKDQALVPDKESSTGGGPGTKNGIGHHKTWSRRQRNYPNITQQERSGTTRLRTKVLGKIIQRTWSKRQ